MNYVEKLHLDSLESPQLESELICAHADNAAKKSAEITKKIAIEFAKFVDDNSDEPQFDLVQWTYESWFEEFMKSKQPNDGIQTS
jgi:hypothetical protein